MHCLLFRSCLQHVLISAANMVGSYCGPLTLQCNQSLPGLTTVCILTWLQVIDSSGRPDGWLDAAKQLKGLSGTPLTDMVLFSGSLHIVRHGNRLGMSASHVRGRGLTVAQLKSSLAAFAAKKLDDRGY